MKTTTRPLSLKDLSPATLSAFSKERGEPDWVLSLRLKAFENYTRLPFPTDKDEHWKRTHLEKLNWNALQFSPAPVPALKASELKGYLREVSSAPSQNGTPARAFWDFTQGYLLEMPEPLRERSIEWIPLDIAVKTQAERVQTAWTAAVDRAKEHKFISLTLALGNVGSVLIVPKGQIVKTPFQSYVSAGESNQAKFFLNFIFMDEAAEAQVWEELHGDEGSSVKDAFVSSFTSLTLKENAKANCFFLQNWDSQTAQFQFQDIFQGAFSKYNAIAVSLGGKLFHNETTVHLHGQGAENKVLGVLFGDQEQNFVNWVTQNHTAPRTTSDIQYRGALKGASRSFFSGMVYINKDAQQSDAYQAAKCLLLSKDARADAIPNLEILADDVKCSHGAAVGPVDEDQKYYLETRGIRSKDAEEIIIQGFLEPVISEIPSTTAQDQLRSFVEKKIKSS